MSGKPSARRGFSGHRETPGQPQNVVLGYTPPNDWNVGFDDPPATDKTEVLLYNITAAPVLVASTTTAAGAGEADVVFVPVVGQTYRATIRFSRNGEPGKSANSNSVTP